jgi:3-hydroxyacyl-[acyl-carrier-protein] dehydratase
MWIDRIVELVPRERMVAVKSVSLAEEYVHDHFPADAELSAPAQPVMPFSLVIEGMAQTAGILVGHAGDFAEKVILAKIAKASIKGEPLPGQTLRYTATITRLDENGAATEGVIEVLDHAEPEAGYQQIGRVDLLFSHIDRNRAGAVFPEHNFVFGEGFKTLLRNSGVEVG